ncbi:trehalose-phosphatase [Oryzifoliimicrobium ureilyticus]|uniref:trehalose-phosphatase n=1 Tax=Oryzifoliimicrobium ureilyticus TaxID=3113724 RepID=UPI003075FDBB
MSSEPKPTSAAEAGSVSGRKALTEILLSRPREYALFLDIDGTLLDLASTPDGIEVPDELPAVLNAVSARLGGALALVTGRGLAYAEKLFLPFSFPVAGLHGAERRDADGNVEKLQIPDAFLGVKRQMAAVSDKRDGILFEDKGAAAALHYRLAPDCKDELEQMMEAAVRQLGSEFKLQRGKMVFEIRPALADKGHAMEAFLEKPPFAGRLPVTVGDDVTDEAMFGAALHRGGLAIRVGDLTSATKAQMNIGSAAELREILQAAVR